VVPKPVVERLVEGLLRFSSVAILSDEIYSCMLFDGQHHVSLLQYPELAERVIMLDGWSKTYAMTGWRLGYAVWPEALVEHATRLAVNCHSCVNAASQHAGIAALQGEQSAVTQMMEAFDNRRGAVVEGLNAIDGVRCQMPGGAFYVFPNITGTGQSARDLQQRLLERDGVATIAGTSFGAYGEGYLRLSYANSLENIEAALQRMRASIGAL
jgi:aspartate/methionine/tyrosine aminotransferase